VSCGSAETRVAIVHTSKNIAGNPDTLLMPLGLVALGSYLSDNGYVTEVLHLELEEALNPNFDLLDHLSLKNVEIVCLDLHWHYQASKVIEIAGKLKRGIPGIKVVIGGFTASFFAEEIMKDHGSIDFIIKGDAEIPLLRLVEAIVSGKGAYERVPNLVFRRDGEVVSNEHSYIIDQETIDGLRFSNYSIVSNGDKYNKLHLNLPECLTCKGECEEKCFYYNCGRGCPVNCSFCGGSNISQKAINKRESPIFISHESVLRELRSALSQGLSTWYTCFDPDPSSDYYPELFRKIRGAKLDMSLQYESWALPSKEFIDEFAETFDSSGSEIILSPETGSDRIRKRNKGLFYTNGELIETVEYCVGMGLRVKLYFTAGLPFEERSDLLKSLNLIDRLRKMDGVKVVAFPIEYEPGSPIYYHREKYGIKSVRVKFKDYLDIHRERSDIGYRTDFFTNREIVEAVALMNAESRCVFSKSFFMKYISGDPACIEGVDIMSLRKLCRQCDRYSICYIDVMNRGEKNRAECWR